MEKTHPNPIDEKELEKDLIKEILKFDNPEKNLAIDVSNGKRISNYNNPSNSNSTQLSSLSGSTNSSQTGMDKEEEDLVYKSQHLDPQINEMKFNLMSECSSIFEEFEKDMKIIEKDISFAQIKEFYLNFKPNLLPISKSS